MIAFAFIDSHGNPTSGGVRRVLPDGAIPLTSPYTTADLGRIRWRDGTWEERADLAASAASVEGLALEAARELDLAKAMAIDRIKERVGQVRKRIYTDIPGQDALYLEKRAEAQAYVREAQLTGEPLTLDAYPLLAGEVGVTAETAWQLAQIWLDRADRFKAFGVATEALRMRAAAAVIAAPDHATLQRIEAAFVSNLTTLQP